MAYDFSKLKEHIKETEEWLARELSGVRTGRAAPSLFDGLKPEAYGARTPLRELASVSVEDARTLRIIPWDMGLLKAIEKAITEANLGVGIASDDQGLRVSFPELTGERRTQLLKIAGEKTETAKAPPTRKRSTCLADRDIITSVTLFGEGAESVVNAVIDRVFQVDGGSFTIKNSLFKISRVVGGFLVSGFWGGGRGGVVFKFGERDVYI